MKIRIVSQGYKEINVILSPHLLQKQNEIPPRFPWETFRRTSGNSPHRISFQEAEWSPLLKPCQQPFKWVVYTCFLLADRDLYNVDSVLRRLMSTELKTFTQLYRILD